MEQRDKCVCAAEKRKRFRVFRLECQQAGIQAPNFRDRAVIIRTDAGTLIGWAYYGDHNFGRKFGRLWSKGKEVERLEKRRKGAR